MKKIITNILLFTWSLIKELLIGLVFYLDNLILALLPQLITINRYLYKRWKVDKEGKKQSLSRLFVWGVVALIIYLITLI